MTFQLVAEQACESLIDDLNHGEYSLGLTVDYLDNFWFAGFCLSTSFSPTVDNRLFLDDPEVIADYELQCELISCCSYTRRYNQATGGLYHDLSI